MYRGRTLLEQRCRNGPIYVRMAPLASLAAFPGCSPTGFGAGRCDHHLTTPTLAECKEPPGLTPLTTVLLRNIPKAYDRDMLTDLLDSTGFACAYDFVYLPIDFRKRRGLGYATVNFVSHAQARRAIETFTSFSDWKADGTKAGDAIFSISNQGIESNVQYYRNREMMHPDVPDLYKPLLFKNGVRVAFPAPTQEIKLPKQVISKLQQVWK